MAPAKTERTPKPLHRAGVRLPSGRPAALVSDLLAAVGGTGYDVLAAWSTPPGTEGLEVRIGLAAARL